MDSSSKQLQLIKRPILEGHNNNFSYRSLGLIHPLYKYFNYALDINFLKVEAGKRYLSPNHFRSTYNFSEVISLGSKYFQRESITNFLINTFSKENEKILKRLPYLFILYDINYRNIRDNKEKSLCYKLKFSTDVALYHTMATLYFPYKALKYSNSVYYMCSNFLKNPSILMNALGLFAGFYLFFKIVKFGDIASDYVMNNTFRKFVFDYRNEIKENFNEEFEKIKELENRFYNKK
jgi:hypothetical protein